MIRKAFSIRDTKAEIYHPPFYAHSPGEAERMFGANLDNEESMIKKFPEDFDLFEVGEFDDQSGKFSPLDTPHHIVKASNIVRRHNTAVASTFDRLHEAGNKV